MGIPDHLTCLLRNLYASQEATVGSEQQLEHGTNFPNLGSICSMPGFNCCFLTCIQISQEAGQVV